MRRLAPLWAALAVTLMGTPLVTVGLLAAVYRVMLVPNVSMEPAVPSGSYVLVNRLQRDPRPGDIIVYRPSAQPRTTALKRVIAVGGQTVACCEGDHITVDSKALQERYVSYDDKQSFGPVTVPAGRLWMMGDARGKSADSRIHIHEEFQGTVAVADVFGTAAGATTAPHAYGEVLLRALLGCLPTALVVAGIMLVSRRRARPRLAGGPPRRTLVGP